MKNLIFFLTVILVSISTFMYSQTTYDMWGPNSPNEILKVNMLDPGIGSTPKLIMESSGIFVDNGNIGIGLSSPTAKLHVDGTILSNNDISGTNIIGSIKTQSIQPAILPNKLTITAKPTESRFICQSNGEFSLGRINDSFNNQYGLFEIGNLGSSSYALSIHSETNGLVIKTEEEVYELATPISVRTWDGVNTFKVKGNGDVHFSGNLFQNNQEFVEGKWQEQGSHIYFNNGFVGIGTDNPLAELQIGDDFTFARGLGTNSKYICKNAYFDAEFKYINTDASSMINFTPPGDIMFNTAPQGDANDSISWSSRFVIKNGGNVGIGTSSPNYKLEVEGQLKSLGFILEDGTQGNGKILVSDANGVASWIDPTSIDDGDWTINGSNIYRMNGSVGIGTSNTSEAMLTVNGKIISSEIEVMTNVPSSDFVFEDDYTLMDLQTLELFVKKNKHLPEIPSASEFAENGYNMNDMDDLLLRKVEELTLYIIDLKKEISQLKSE